MQNLALTPLFWLLGLALVPGWAQGAGFDFAALQTLITTQHIRSVDQLLPQLPAALRYRYALVFASRSLQGASFGAPRAILYGPTAQLIVSFNGDPDQRGFDALETMEFDDATGRFEFREISFPSSPGDPAPVAVSELNPSRCVRCHGQPARPVWDAQPLWPGAYGERYLAHLSAEEQAGIAQFLARQPTDPRYRQLLGAERFADPQTFRPSLQSHYSSAPPEPPNAELALLLDQWTSRSIARELTERPDFPAYQYLLLGAVDSRCGGLEEFYPADRRAAISAAYRRYRAAREDADRLQRAAQALRLTPGNRDYAAPLPGRGDADLSAVQFIAESELALPAGAWTLALEKGMDATPAAPAVLSELRGALLAPLAARDPRISEFSDYATTADGDRYCRYLRTRSRAALAGRPPRSAPAPAPASASAPAPAAAAPAVVQLCASCHESGIAPPIPFRDAGELQGELRSRPTAHGHLLDEIRFRLSAAAGAGRMPFGVNLTDEQRAEVERYFVELAAQVH